MRSLTTRARWPLGLAAALLLAAPAPPGIRAAEPRGEDERDARARELPEDSRQAVPVTEPGGRPAWPAGSLGRQIGQDLGRVFTRPFRLRGREWALPAALAGGAGALYLLRDEIREEVQESRSAVRDEFLQDVRVTGKGAFVPALAGVLAWVGAARDSSREKQTALLLIESFAVSAVYTGIGSTLLAAERPEDGNSVRTLETGGHGFSLDTALAASMIAPLDRAYFAPRPGESRARRGWRRAGRALLYLVPALVAYQRLNQDKHWAPDVFLGYATGLLSGRVLAQGYGPSGGREVQVSAGGLRLRF